MGLSPQTCVFVLYGRQLMCSCSCVSSCRALLRVLRPRSADVKGFRSAGFRHDGETTHDFIQYWHNLGFYISAPLAISQWKCSNLISLTILSVLSVFLCYVSHSSDLGMIIIGLKSLSWMQCSVQYTHKYTHSCTHEWRWEHTLQWDFWSWKKDDLSLLINTEERGYNIHHFFFIHNTQGGWNTIFKIKYAVWFCSRQTIRQIWSKMFLVW